VQAGDARHQIGDHPRDDGVRNQLAALHVAVRLNPRRRLPAHRVTQQIAARHMPQRLIRSGQPPGDRPFARTRASQQNNDVHHCHTVSGTQKSGARIQGSAIGHVATPSSRLPLPDS